MASPKSKFQVSGFRGRLTRAGYGGYVPGVKSENVFGQTYGKTSYASSTGGFHRGMDEPPSIKYKSLFKQEYVQHDGGKHETTAQIVGVNRNEDAYKKVRNRAVNY